MEQWNDRVVAVNIRRDAVPTVPKYCPEYQRLARHCVTLHSSFWLVPSNPFPMPRRPSFVAVVASLVAMVSITTAAMPPRAPHAARRALVTATPPAEEAVNIDWRVLAGLDYSNGKATDTLKKLDGKLVRIPGFVEIGRASCRERV